MADKEYDEAYEDAIAEEDGKPTSRLYSEFTSPLGTELSALFDICKNDRRNIEDRWLDDLRQYRGEYSEEIKAKLNPNRSQAFFALTRAKVKTVTAKMLDILFPPNGDKNWGIIPTPLPELSPDLTEEIMVQIMEATGGQVTEDQVKEVLNGEAKKRCNKMQLEMQDQLSELQYREIIKCVIRSGNLYGTGVLKGPLVQKQKVKRWIPEDGGGWKTLEIPKMSPYAEFVDLWDIYPDMTSRKVGDMRHIFQRYLMTRKRLLELANRDDFNGKAIKAYMKAYPDGDAEVLPHELTLKTMSSGEELSESFSISKSKYDVKEFWGYLSTDKLREAGIKIPKKLEDSLEVAANVWMVGPLVIKSVVSPIEGTTFPYFFYYFEKDETSVFGEGLPYIMRDTQELINASVRALLDNAAISAGPIIEANMDLLAQGEDPSKLYPFRVFQREGVGMEASQPAIRVHTLPSYTQEFLGMVRFFMELGDEITSVPRYIQGDNSNLTGAGRTATGLSLLLGQSNIVLTSQVKNFDDGITEPFIKSLFYWNMEFNPKRGIRGDYTVVCKGSTSLIAKEVRSESLNQFLAIAGSEIFAPYVNFDALLREMTKNMDLQDLGIIKSTEQVNTETDAQNKAAAEDKQFEQQMAVMKADSGGHTKGGQGGPTPEEAAQGERLTMGDIVGV